jgi:hypothetical protein
MQQVKEIQEDHIRDGDVNFYFNENLTEITYDICVKIFCIRSLNKQ